ncbi:MAG TPA: DMT family transporter [Clostridia bacterium]|nr:DMT family transporter [Clostridia bacterium]
MIAILFGILAGASIVAGRMINARLSTVIGPYRGTFYNYVTGLSLSLMVLFLSGEVFPALSMPETFRQYAMYTGGFLGVIVVLISNIITPRMSAFLLTLLIFVSQLVSGIVIDALNGTPVSIGKLVGGALVLAGVLYNRKIEHKEKTDNK